MALLENSRNIELLQSHLSFSLNSGLEMVCQYKTYGEELKPGEIKFGHPEEPHSIERPDYKPEVIVVHTHLCGSRPSIRDILSMVWSVAINHTSFHIVLTHDPADNEEYRFVYYPTDDLTGEIQELYTTFKQFGSANTVDFIKQKTNLDLVYVSDELKTITSDCKDYRTVEQLLKLRNAVEIRRKYYNHHYERVKKRINELKEQLMELKDIVNFSEWTSELGKLGITMFRAKINVGYDLP